MSLLVSLSNEREFRVHLIRTERLRSKNIHNYKTMLLLQQVRIQMVTVISVEETVKENTFCLNSAGSMFGLISAKGYKKYMNEEI